MIMYFIATGKQPFPNCAHDELLALNICNGIRPEINEPEAPKCYIDLMKNCWDSDPDNRPNAIGVEKLIYLFYDSLSCTDSYKYEIIEIEYQFKKAEEYKESNFSFLEEKRQSTTHPQAIYTSRLLNPFTRDLPNYDLNSQFLDCEITD